VRSFVFQQEAAADFQRRLQQDLCKTKHKARLVAAVYRCSLSRCWLGTKRVKGDQTKIASRF
jgi:hypothetical protein